MASLTFTHIEHASPRLAKLLRAVELAVQFLELQQPPPHQAVATALRNALHDYHNLRKSPQGEKSHVNDAA